MAALSSCHMLFFLSLAAADGLVVSRYEDEATGTLGKLPDGRLGMTEVVLRPEADYAGPVAPDAGQIAQLHHAAHEQCFIANSVVSELKVEIVR